MPVLEDDHVGFLAEASTLLVMYHKAGREEAVVVQKPPEFLSREQLEWTTQLALVESQLGIVPFEAQVAHHFEVFRFLVDIDDLIDSNANLDLERLLGRRSLQRRPQPLLGLCAGQTVPAQQRRQQDNQPTRRHAPGTCFVLVSTVDWIMGSHQSG